MIAIDIKVESSSDRIEDITLMPQPIPRTIFDKCTRIGRIFQISFFTLNMDLSLCVWCRKKSVIGSQPRSNRTVCNYCVSGVCVWGGGGGGGVKGYGITGLLTTLHSISGYTVEIFLSS